MTKQDEFETALELIKDFSTVEDAKMYVRKLVAITDKSKLSDILTFWQGVLNEIELIQLEKNSSFWHQYQDQLVIGGKGEEGVLSRIDNVHYQLHITVTTESKRETLIYPMRECKPVFTNDPDQQELNFHDGKN